jgi:hypothetical protein
MPTLAFDSGELRSGVTGELRSGDPGEGRSR